LSPPWRYPSGNPIPALAHPAKVSTGSNCRRPAEEQNVFALGFRDRLAYQSWSEEVERFRDLCGGYESSTNAIPRVRKINPKLISRNLEEDEIFPGFGRFPCIIKDAKVT